MKKKSLTLLTFQIQEKVISEMNLKRDGGDKTDIEKHFKIIY